MSHTKLDAPSDANRGPPPPSLQRGSLRLLPAPPAEPDERTLVYGQVGAAKGSVPVSRRWEVVSPLPLGESSGSRTLVAREGERLVVLRQLEGEPVRVAPARGPALSLLDVVAIGNVRYAAFELLRAVSLRDISESFLGKKQLLPLGFVARVVADAGRAAGPLGPHGGLGDGSLLVGFDGETRLLDFGAPRVSRFQAPEAPSLSSDVFALGAVLHSTLTGFKGSYGQALSDGVELPPASRVNPAVPPALDALVMRALSADPAVRQSDGVLLAMELEATLGRALFSTGDVATLVEMLLGARRKQLEALADRRAPTPAPSPAPPDTDFSVDVELDFERVATESGRQAAPASPQAPSAPSPAPVEASVAVTKAPVPARRAEGPTATADAPAPGPMSAAEAAELLGLAPAGSAAASSSASGPTRPKLAPGHGASSHKAAASGHVHRAPRGPGRLVAVAVGAAALLAASVSLVRFGSAAAPSAQAEEGPAVDLAVVAADAEPEGPALTRPSAARRRSDATRGGARAMPSPRDSSGAPVGAR